MIYSSFFSCILSSILVTSLRYSRVAPKYVAVNSFNHIFKKKSENPIFAVYYLILILKLPKMKRILLIVISIIVMQNLFSQNDINHIYLHEVSVNYGVMPHMTQRHQPSYIGKIFSIESANYFTNNIGFRTGFSSISDLEGVNSYYAVPLYFSYRTDERRDFGLVGNIDSFNALFSNILFNILPRKFEFVAGSSLGYINPDNSESYIIIDDRKFINDFYVERNFSATVDLGLKLIYKFNRIGVDLSGIYSYLVTKNFVFHSDLPFDWSDGFHPLNFMKLQVGLSYSF